MLFRTVPSPNLTLENVRLLVSASDFPDACLVDARVCGLRMHGFLARDRGTNARLQLASLDGVPTEATSLHRAVRRAWRSFCARRMGELVRRAAVYVLNFMSGDESGWRRAEGGGEAGLEAAIMSEVLNTLSGGTPRQVRQPEKRGMDRRSVLAPGGICKEGFADFRVVGQVDKKFIIVVDEHAGSEKDMTTLYAVDEHAASERFLYERYLKDALAGRTTSSTLPNAQRVHVTYAQRKAAEERKREIEQWGWGIQMSKLDEGVIDMVGVPNLSFLRSTNMVLGSEDQLRVKLFERVCGWGVRRWVAETVRGGHCQCRLPFRCQVW